MRDRGKRELEGYINNGDGDPNIPDFPCKKHPASCSSSSIGGGICAYCLTDRLVQLVCPDCGEQRLPYCSCSEQISSSSTHGETARISFLLENEKNGVKTEQDLYKKQPPNDPDFATLRRSSSISAVDFHKRREQPNSGTGFWKFGKLFRKRREKKGMNNNQNEESKSEMGGVSDCVGVSRSRSLCSFRGLYDNNSTEESGGFPVSSSSAARASSVSANFHIDSAKRSCFSESEARISNFDYYDASFLGGPKQSIFSLKESEFMSEDPAFIDLKLSEVDARPELRRGGTRVSEFGFRGGGGGEEMFRNNGGSSCRISVRERELRKCKKSSRVWRWFFRHQSSSTRKDEDDRDFAFKS